MATIAVVVLQADVAAGTRAVVVVGAVTAAVFAVVLGRREAADFGDLERSRVELRRAVRRLGDVLEATSDRKALVEAALETAQVMTGAETALFLSDVGSALVVAAERGDVAPDLDGARLDPTMGVAGRAAVSGHPARWPGEPGDGPVAPEPAARTAAAIPVRARGRLYGVLALYGRARPFSAGDLDDLASFCRQAEAAIEATYLHEEARRLSITDGLTGVWNRRHFDLRVGQELERAHRFGEGFAVVLCDLDDFKAVNDTYGHQAGDAALVELARRLVEAVREVDLVARYGGEEFVLLLPRTAPDGAATVAEKVRASVAAKPVLTESASLDLTISIGVSCHPENGDTVAELVRSADRALYRAKAAGKDRVIVATGRTSS